MKRPKTKLKKIDELTLHKCFIGLSLILGIASACLGSWNGVLQSVSYALLWYVILSYAKSLNRMQEVNALLWEFVSLIRKAAEKAGEDKAQQPETEKTDVL